MRIDYDITSIIIEPSFFVRAHMHLHNETIFAVMQDALVAAGNNGEKVEGKEVKLNMQVCVSENCNTPVCTVLECHSKSKYLPEYNSARLVVKFTLIRVLKRFPSLAEDVHDLINLWHQESSRAFETRHGPL